MVHCIGDSHVFVFTGVDSGGRDNLPFFRTHRLGPFTAYNVIKRVDLIHDTIKAHVKTGDIIMFCFGEIDCRVHLLKQSEIQQLPLDQVVDNCVQRYFNIFEITKQHGFQLMAWNVPPSSREHVENGEFTTYGSCKERNEVSRLFNSRLQLRCQKHGVIFMSIFDKLLAEDGLTNPFYYLDNIHLSSKAIPFILEEFEKQGIPLNGRVRRTLHA
jgi:hypothetical protein